MIGRLHRDQAQKLHHVVLDHVPDRAGLVVIAAASGHAHGLGHGDLDVVHVLRVPQRFEQHVGKAHRHQVLDGLLAQVMVDPIDLLFVEMLRQRGVQRLGAGQVAAERLFHHDATVVIGDAVARQKLGDVAEQRRRDREIERMDRALAHPVLQRLPAALALGVDGDIAQQAQKLGQLRVVRLGAREFADGLGRLGAEGVVVLVGARGTDDLAGGRELSRLEAAVETGQDLAMGQIARGAKDHEVEVIDRNDTRDHAVLLLGGVRLTPC